MAYGIAMFLFTVSPIVWAQQPVSGDAGVDFLNFDCAAGPHASTWISVKKKMRRIFEKDGGALLHTEKSVLRDILADVNKELKDSTAFSKEASSECGLGKLSFQLLSVAIIEPEALIQLFSTEEQLASPVLTTLLDVPWLAVAQSGWPIFGLLAEVNLQKLHAGVMNKDFVDGLDKPIGQAFYRELMEAVVKGDGPGIGQVTNVYLTMENEKNTFASLTALVAGASGADAKQRMQLMDTTQNFLKQAISSPQELDLALGTRWPLWGLMHSTTDVFML